MERRYNEYVGALITYYRKSRRGEDLTLTDKQHKHWSTAEGYPVCCGKTVYNIQQGKMDNDMDSVIFIVDKLGYKFCEDGENAMAFFTQIFKRINEYIEKDCSSMSCLRDEINNCVYKNYFLFDIYSELANCVIDFYSLNTLEHYIPFQKKKYNKAIFTDDMTHLADLLDCYYYLFVENDAYRVNQIVGKPWISFIDKNILFTGQSSTVDSLEVQIDLLKQQIEKMPEGNKKHFSWLMMTIIKTAALAFGKEVDIEPYHNVMMNRILNAKKPLDNMELKKLFNKRNPLLFETYWRQLSMMLDQPYIKANLTNVKKILKRYCDM